MSWLIEDLHTPHRHDLQHQHQSQTSFARRHAVRGRVFVAVVALVLLVAAVPTVFYVNAHRTERASNRPSANTLTNDEVSLAQPADRFMQSIVTDDGALGWKQLCPDVQAQLPLGALVQQANAQHTALAQQGVRLTVAFMGVHPQQNGGTSHQYIVTAHWPGGGAQMRMYTVLTHQQSGCVEDVQNS